MGKMIDRLIGTPEAHAKARAAREYLETNDAVIVAEDELPRWRRGPR